MQTKPGQKQSIKEAVETLAAFDTPEWRRTVPKANTTDIGIAAPKALERIRSLAKMLKGIFVSRDEIIDLMLICAIAQEPMLLFGPPGTAKSEMVAKLAEGLGARFSHPAFGSRPYFEYLLSAFTEPDELLGPVVVNELLHPEHPSYRRFGQGMMPGASIVFLDEVFRGSSAILNILLSLINERRVYEAGTTHKADTLMIFGAANRPPVGDELLAFYERFPIRAWCDLVDLDHADDRRELLRRAWKLETQRLRAGYDPEGFRLDQFACLTDLLLVNRAAMVLWGGEDLDKDEALKPFNDIYCRTVTNLNKDTTFASRLVDDRKYVKLYKLIRVKAYYERMDRPKIADLSLLTHIWPDSDSREWLADRIKTVIQERGGK